MPLGHGQTIAVTPLVTNKRALWCAEPDARANWDAPKGYGEFANSAEAKTASTE